jgi:hypothetical protein
MHDLQEPASPSTPTLTSGTRLLSSSIVCGVSVWLS